MDYLIDRAARRLRNNLINLSRERGTSENEILHYFIVARGAYAINPRESNRLFFFFFYRSTAGDKQIESSTILLVCRRVRIDRKSSDCIKI